MDFTPEIGEFGLAFMRSTKYYIALIFGSLCLLATSTSMAANIPAGKMTELEQQKYCNAPVVKASTDQNRIPFSNNNSADHGGAGGKYITASDAVPHVSVTTISSLTFAIVISLVNNDDHNPPGRTPAEPKLTVLHKVLFTSIISPNAP